ncbi:P-loop containing nucleoside triphosphate hydrolase protein [Peniophora sp. CONT]|nr:P-loop containing nucleoside triphosphate hydrolase protein [Peniophora sp. CONT]
MLGVESTPAPVPSPQPLPRDGHLNAAEKAEAERTRVFLVGVGGATCSGKTTLAKHLRNVLPNSFIIHQDDFAPPQDTLPVHPELGADWDSAPTAIDWPRLRAFLHIVKDSATIPADHSSHDHLNNQVPVPVTDNTYDRVKARIVQKQREIEEREGVRVVWGLVDGFLLYWDKEVVDTLDVKIFLRVPQETLKQRREERSGYATAEGTFWKDPPGYWDRLVYPAYVDAHKHIFENGDLDNGAPVLPGITVLEPLQLSMDAVVEHTCAVIEDALEHRKW